MDENKVMKPIATNDGNPWSFLGGTPFNAEVAIFSPEDGAAVLRFRIAPTEAIHPPEGAAYRTLAKWFPDGTVKYLLIDFTHEADSVVEEVPHQP